MCLLLSAAKITKIYAQDVGGGGCGSGGIWGFFRQRVLSMFNFSVVLQCLFDMHKRYYRVR